MKAATTYGYEERKQMAAAMRVATGAAKKEFDAAEAAFAKEPTDANWEAREQARLHYLSLANAQP